MFDFGPKELQIIQENPETFSKSIIWEISKSWNSNILTSLEKTGPENPEDSPNDVLKLLKMGSISSRKHEMDILEDVEYGISIYQRS